MTTPAGGYTCACCGHRTLSRPPPSYEVCQVCYWQDDEVQLLDPGYRGGANGPSLVEAQACYQALGASEEQWLDDVRPPTPDEVRDPDWRPATDADVRAARLPRDVSSEEWERPEAWYYWKRPKGS